MAAPVWWLTKDGDTDCLAMYERHYSGIGRTGRRRVAQFVGPGEHIVLRTEAGDAFFVWRKFIDDSGQDGINCAAFRNESRYQSSELVRQADAIAECSVASLQALHLCQRAKGTVNKSWLLFHRGRVEAMRNDQGRTTHTGARPMTRPRPRQAA